MNTQTKNQHTPGPWRVGEPTDCGMMIEAGNGKPVAEALPDYNQDFEANARLIAAAPELLRDLAALVNMLAAEDGAISVSLRPLYRQALDTIAKATQ